MGPSRLAAAVLALAALATACAPQPEASPIRISHPSDLAGSAWELVTIQERSPTAGPPVTLVFGRGELSGNGSCNAFGGTYAYDPATGALRIDGLVSTKRACVEPGRNELEAAYLASLRSAADASIDPAGRLVISGAGAPLVLAVAGVPAGPPVTAPPGS
jgi:heat shock protein HslJ